jgi:hypothetical protein
LEVKIFFIVEVVIGFLITLWCTSASTTMDIDPVRGLSIDLRSYSCSSSLTLAAKMYNAAVNLGISKVLL